MMKTTPHLSVPRLPCLIASLRRADQSLVRQCHGLLYTSHHIDPHTTQSPKPTASRDCLPKATTSAPP